MKEKFDFYHSFSDCREQSLPGKSKSSPAKEFLSTFKESFKSPTHKIRGNEVNSEVVYIFSGLCNT